MNQRVAKMIRKEVYGSKSRRQQDYEVFPHIKKIIKMIKGEKKEEKIIKGQLLCTGLRAKYKKVKKEYKRIKEEGFHENWRHSSILNER